MKDFYELRHYLTGKKSIFILGTFAGLIFAISSGLGTPYFIKVVFAEVFESNSDAYSVLEILLIASQLPAIFLVRGISGYYNQFWMNNCALYILQRLREDLFVKIQHLPLAYHDKQKSGDLLSRFLSDTTLIQDTLQRSANDLVRAPMQVFFAFCALVYLSFQNNELTFIYLVFLAAPMAGIPVFLIGKRLKIWGSRMQVSQAEMTDILSENLDSTTEIRTFNLEKNETSKFDKQLNDLFEKQMKTVKYQIMSQPLVETLSAILIAASFVICYIKSVELSTFLAMGFVIYMITEPLKKIFRIYSNVKKTQGAMDRIKEILDEPDTVSDPKKPVPLESCRGDIEFKDISFAYKKAPVLQNVSASIKSGQAIALVGPSGAGKSTFARLIPRLYEVTEGCIEIDGTDIRNFKKDDLRNNIAVVSQKPVLFNDTLFNNIQLGRPGATEEEVYEAAKNAFAHDFILEFEDGYQTLAGERGDRLSGGQCQRIAIARAFLRNAPILILDEATSALDAQGEEEIQKAVATLVKGKTVIIIAHRFSTIRLADSIFVFESGRIVASGPHKELYNSNELYTKLYDKQM